MNKSSYIRIGAFALAAMALAILALALMGRGKSRGRELLFETYIEETVQGISEGSAVKYRGIPIGSVKSVSFARSHYGHLSGTGRMSPETRRALRYARIVFSIDTSDAPSPDAFLDLMRAHVQDGLRAHTKSQGITGLSYIDLDFESYPRDLPVPWIPEHPYIPTAPSFVKTLTDVMQSLTQELGTFVQIKDSVTNLAARTTSLATTAGEALRKIDTSLNALPAAMASATNAIADADSLVRSMAPAAGALPALATNSVELIAEARAALKALADDGRAALAEASNAVSSAGAAVPSITGPAIDAAEALARAADEIAAFAAELREDPSTLIRRKERDSLK